MTTCSGLPICLSGIQIFPHHVQRPKRQHMRPNMQVQVVSPVDTPSRSLEAESVSSDCENGGSTAMPVTASSSDMLRENSSSQERSGSDRHSNMRNLPRLALVQQMADLDCRREAVRRRSLRAGTSSLVDYRLSSQQSGMLSILLETQARLEEGSCTEKSVCAKAA